MPYGIDAVRLPLPTTVYHGRGISRDDLLYVLECGLPGRDPDAPASHPLKPSVSGLTYVTTHYPIFYAAQNAERCGADYACVFEIETAPLSTESCFPDEDFLDEVALCGEILRPWATLSGSTEQTPRLDPRSYAWLWNQSMSRLGNFSVDGAIALDLVTRIGFVQRQCDLLGWLNVDEHITIDSARPMKVFHGAVLAACLDGVLPKAEVVYEILPTADDVMLERFVGDARAAIAAHRVIARPASGWNIEYLHDQYDAIADTAS